MSSEQNQTKAVPPYVSFATFLRAIETLAEHGVPAQIDRSVLGKFSGSAQRHIIQAFRYLKLIDVNDSPTAELKNLTQKNKEARKGVLVDIIKFAYPNQVKVLSDGTDQLLRSSFDDIKVEPSVKSKCISFFLKAAQEAGLEISSHILRAKRAPTPRREAPRRRKKRTEKKKVGKETIEKESEVPQIEGLISIPIALGPNKVWYVQVEEDCSKDDIERFTKIIGMVLG